MSEYRHLLQLMGTIATRQMASSQANIQKLSDAEFRVFSQFGDDGIIQYLIRNCELHEIEHRFVEFGTESYIESNTRFLLVNDNWSGFIMDSSKDYISQIRSDEISVRHDLQAHCCFVTPYNLNNILRTYCFDNNVGLFSIDIDGMDYWVWKSLSVVNPVIVLCEYNSVFGPRARVTVPFKENFNRTSAHHSNLYAGASLDALVHLASEKGYSFVGSNSAGNTAYFIRNDRIGNLKPLTTQEGYVESKFRESRDEEGCLTHVRAEERLQLIKHMPVYDINSGLVRSLGETV